ncbi:ribonuclease G [Bacteroidia bacterium]|nr:ribonuclease G [Bacteroidia bacterium]
MNKELIIDSKQGFIDIALVEDKLLTELHHEESMGGFAESSLYLGRIKKCMSGLNAAFVDVGADKDGFLHLFDMGAQIKDFNKFVQIATNPNVAHSNDVDISKWSLSEPVGRTENISNIVKQGDHILVQVTKEPISTKGPRLSAEISLPGHFIVLLPLNSKISVSSKIKSAEERKRLLYIIKSILPNNFGVIIRTAAEEKSIEDLDNDLKQLLRKWNVDVINALKNSKPPKLILSEDDKAISVVRDNISEDIDSIVVNDEDTFNDIKEYIKFIGGDNQIVKLYKGDAPIFDAYNVTKQIKASFGKIVPIQRGGAYLVIEHTEALHVVDVNSGHKTDDTASQEENALNTNLQAAEEIARQLRLRDIGGIIVIDFIDMRLSKNRKFLHDKMMELMQKDKAKHHILPPSKFGLIQITRQRVRPHTKIEVLEKCPICAGTGMVKSNILIIDEIEQQLEYLYLHNHKKLTLEVNPFIYAYIKHGFWNILRKWNWKYHKTLKLISNHSFHYLQYKFFNKFGEEIDNTTKS